MPLTARFATTCAVCGGRIEVGAQISGERGAWRHTDCDPADAMLPGLAPEPTVAPPAPRTRARPPDQVAADGALEVWTDGACSGNPGPGGWAWATADGRQGSGGEPHTTNQRMEITAALQAVVALSGPLVVVSDSTYVVNCFRDRWWQGWLARGWVNSAKKPVANRDLWEPLVNEVRDRGDVSFRWVKGHSGDRMNDLVDSLAVAAGAAVAKA